MSVIVSQWELPYSASDLPRIDVTRQIVALFEVDEEVADMVAQMEDVEPVPLEELLYQPEHWATGRVSMAHRWSARIRYC